MNPSPLQNLQSHPEVKAYLSRLKKHLNPLTSEQKAEIHQEIENRIYEELALGSSMASNKEAVLHLLQRMGEPETLAKELKLEYLPRHSRKSIFGGSSSGLLETGTSSDAIHPGGDHRPAAAPQYCADLSKPHNPGHTRHGFRNDSFCA